jgi:putative (di)nucleoside polyphosphate hydrolase
MLIFYAGICKFQPNQRHIRLLRLGGLWKNRYYKHIVIDYPVIDSDGYRPNVGIILCNHRRQLFWARRVGQDAWQFPQGGIKRHESPEEALYRELWEEVGLTSKQVLLLGATRGWLRYKLPKWLRRNDQPTCVGQKQIWFLLRLDTSEKNVQLDRAKTPEFDGWRWVDYWYPLQEVVSFKRDVYKSALEKLEPLLEALPKNMLKRSVNPVLS